MVQPLKAYAILKGAGTDYRLELGQELSIGRGVGNHVQIEAPCVSRQHATLRWPSDQQAPRLIDHGGANGTLLDGRELKNREAVLEGRHEIRLGAEGPAFWVELYQEDGAPLWQGSDAVRLFTDQGEDCRGSLTSDAPLSQLLRALESNRRSGTLRLTLSDGEVELTLCLGQIMAAEGWGSSGIVVVKRCLQAERGTYQFDGDFEPTDEPLNIFASSMLSLTETAKET